MNILVTGGSGFIGTNFIKYVMGHHPSWHICNLDALTYAGNPENHRDIEGDPGYVFVHGDMNDTDLLQALFSQYAFDAVFNFAAESHVDRSIHDPETFLNTNIKGTFRLLKASLDHLRKTGKQSFRFIHISTDEVYGSLGAKDPPFTEETSYNPSSPYSASKASSDHLVKAFYRTYGLPAIVTNCSNNFGPYQFPEKLIPLMITHILDERELPVYGKGENIRDWLYVSDHCEALSRILLAGRPGETYNIGGGEEKTNIDVIRTVCDLVDEKTGRQRPGRELIRFVTDRPGHDFRYAIDGTKIEREVGWKARFAFENALSDTVDWYLDNTAWVRSVQTGEYHKWIRKQYHQ